MKKILEGKRILITGGTGSLGKVLTRRILSGEVGQPAKVIIFSRDEAKQHFIRVEYEHKAAATDEIIYRNSQRLLEFRIGDVRDYGSVASTLHDADIVVNAAAYTAVDRAESQPELAHTINAIAPGLIAEELARTGGLLIHYSTDYVFDGQKSEPYGEGDPTQPLNVYGQTKLAGEQRIAASGCALA